MYLNKIIDGHLDIAWGYQALKRDFLVSAKVKSQTEVDAVKDVEGIATVGYPELYRANVGIVCGTIWVESELSIQPSLGKKYSSIEQAKDMALEQYNYYVSLGKNPDIRIINSTTDIDLCLSAPYTFGIVLLIEGADFIDDVFDLQFWFDKGVRIIAPVWQRNAYGGCSNMGGGLTNKGKTLISNMEKRNMVLDIAHMSKKCADESLSEYSGVVINSHSACQAICPGERQTTDEQIIQIHNKNGIIGLMLWDKILSLKTAHVSFEDILLHINHIYELTGCVDNIAIGSSMDGGFGSLSLPKGMNNIEDLPQIANWLELHSDFSQYEIEKIMFRNWERVFRIMFSKKLE